MFNTIQYDTDIYQYQNYRQFLKNWSEECKSKYSFFSRRYIQRRIGYKSPAFFTQILQNKTKISMEMAYKFARFLRFNPRKTAYFNLLVSYDRAKDPDTRAELYNQIKTFNKPKKSKQLSEYQEEYFSKTYYPIIRELIEVIPFYGKTEEEFERLSELLLSTLSLSANQVKEAIEVLEKLQLIKRDTTERYVTDKTCLSLILETESKTNKKIMVKKQLIRRQILDFIDLSKANIDAVDSSHKLYRIFTFPVTEKQIEEIRQKGKDYLDDVVNIVNQDETGTRIYNLNIQLFPLTKSLEKVKN